FIGFRIKFLDFKRHYHVIATSSLPCHYHITYHVSCYFHNRLLLAVSARFCFMCNPVWASLGPFLGYSRVRVGYV
ncbi:unnamed protein product, partial [Sphenostylis stenocarpa]